MNKQSLDERIQFLKAVARLTDNNRTDGLLKDESFEIMVEMFIRDVIQEVLPEKKPEYVKQRVGRDLYDVPAASYNNAIDTINSNLDSLLTGEKQ
jgi:predicted transcriptional regulator YheO